MLFRHILLLFVCCFVSGLVGCGGDTVAVTGKVVFDGQPGQNIRVLYQGKATETGFVPQAAMAKTDSQGVYSLSLVADGRNGAMPGEYSVFLSWQDPNPDKSVDIEAADYVPVEKCPYKIPPRAKNGRLQITVPPDGTKNADFEFDSEKEDFEETGT